MRRVGKSEPNINMSLIAVIAGSKILNWSSRKKIVYYKFNQSKN